MSYSCGEASHAVCLAQASLGYLEMQPSGAGYDADDGYRFVHRDDSDEIDFRVQFTDDDGNATVSFRGGESAEVNIRNDD